MRKAKNTPVPDVYVVTYAALEDFSVEVVGVYYNLKAARQAAEAHDCWDDDEFEWDGEYFAEHETGLLQFVIHPEHLT